MGGGYFPPLGGGPLTIKPGAVDAGLLFGGTASGSWGQVSASLAADSYITGCLIYDNAASSTAALHLITVELGVGASGSEVTVTYHKGNAGLTPSTGSSVYCSADFYFPAPVKVLAGTRVAIRASVPSGGNWGAYVYQLPVANLEGH